MIYKYMNLTETQKEFFKKNTIIPDKSQYIERKGKKIGHILFYDKYYRYFNCVACNKFARDSAWGNLHWTTIDRHIKKQYHKENILLYENKIKEEEKMYEEYNEQCKYVRIVRELCKMKDDNIDKYYDSSINKFY